MYESASSIDSEMYEATSQAPNESDDMHEADENSNFETTEAHVEPAVARRLRTTDASPFSTKSSAAAVSAALASAASAAAAAAAATAAAVLVGTSVNESRTSVIAPCAAIRQCRADEPKSSRLSVVERDSDNPDGNDKDNAADAAADAIGPSEMIPANRVLLRATQPNPRVTATLAFLTVSAAQGFKAYALRMQRSGESAAAMNWLRLGFAAAALEAALVVGLARSSRVRAALATAPAASLASADYAFVVSVRGASGGGLVYSRLWPWLAQRNKVLATAGTLVPITQANATAAAAFTYRNSKWEWHRASNGTASNGSSVALSGHWRRVAPPCRRPVAWYAASRGHTAAAAAVALARYGENRIDLGAVSLLQLFGARLVSPLALWQVVSCLLSVADGYGANSLTYLAMFAAMELNVAFQEFTRKRALRRDLAADGGYKSRRPGGDSEVAAGEAAATGVLVWRPSAETASLGGGSGVGTNGTWVAIPVALLVPGDLVALRATSLGGSSELPPTTYVVPADLLVLCGEAVVDEATLTGEAVPQTKAAVSGLPGGLSPRLDVANAHRPHVLFAGTKLLSHAPGKNSSFEQQTPAAGDACVCVVLRTGWDSTRGELVRLATRGQEDRGGVAVRAESTKLLAFLLCVGAATAVAVLVQPAAAVPLSAGAAASSAAEAPAAAAAVTSLAAVAAFEFKALAKRLLRASRVFTSVVPSDLDGASSLAFGRLANVLQKTYFLLLSFCRGLVLVIPLNVQHWRLPPLVSIELCHFDGLRSGFFPSFFSAP
jgi:hypothetical protein